MRDFQNETERAVWSAAFVRGPIGLPAWKRDHAEEWADYVLDELRKLTNNPADWHGQYDRVALARLFARPVFVVGFMEWMAEQPCTNGSGQACRANAPNNPEWCCPACRAWLLCYGAPQSEVLGLGPPVKR